MQRTDGCQRGGGWKDGQNGRKRWEVQASSLEVSPEGKRYGTGNIVSDDLTALYSDRGQATLTVSLTAELRVPLCCTTNTNVKH